MKKLYNRFLALAVALALALSLCSCAEVESGIHDMDSSITGHTYTCEFYSNDGEKFMTLTGDKIDMTPNIVREHAMLLTFTTSTTIWMMETASW